MTAFTQDAGTAVPGNGGATILRDPDHISRGPGPFVMDAATLDGDKVVNAAGEDIGKIEAIMLDVAAGRIAYAVLSFGGFFGIGSKLFAIPWSALTLDAAEKRFMPTSTSVRTGKTTTGCPGVAPWRRPSDTRRCHNGDLLQRRQGRQQYRRPLALLKRTVRRPPRLCL